LRFSDADLLTRVKTSEKIISYSAAAAAMVAVMYSIEPFSTLHYWALPWEEVKTL
jgi:hypothetical protein